MKKYFFSFLAIVLAISLSAFSYIGVDKKTDNAFWYKVDPASKEVLQEYGFVSRESAKTSSGCNGASILCGKGYSTDIYNVGDLATQATTLNMHKN